MILSIIFACQPETMVHSDQIVESKEPVVQYESLPFPKAGVLMDGMGTLSECLEKVPSCECIQDSNQQSCFPQFAYEQKSIPHLMKEAITGVTWQQDCPIHLDDLRLVRVLHWTEDERIQWGELIVTERVANDVQQVFKGLYQLRFPVHSIKPAHLYEGSDEQSMADNNTSSFNCRKIRGTNIWSEHSYGEALDINPLWNPWVKGSKVLPKNADRFVNRELVLPGMINIDSPILTVLDESGWHWGSQKKGVKDYQHFSRKDHTTFYAD